MQSSQQFNFESNVNDLCGSCARDHLTAALNVLVDKNIRHFLSISLKTGSVLISFMFCQCICYLIVCKSTCACLHFELHSCLIKGDGLLSFHKQPIPCSVVPILAFKFNYARLHPAIGDHNTCKYNLPDKSIHTCSV